MKIKQFDWFILMINAKIERRKFKLKKKMASRSKRFSLEHAVKFVTVSDDEEFSEIESSESESDSNESNSDYLDASEENLGGNVKSSSEVDTTHLTKSTHSTENQSSGGKKYFLECYSDKVTEVTVVNRKHLYALLHPQQSNSRLHKQFQENLVHEMVQPNRILMKKQILHPL